MIVCALSLFLWKSGAASAFSEDAASEFAVRIWRTEDGLPQNSVTAIAQTFDGYLWIGTRNGLVRFDGLRFVTFNRLNTPELASNRIVALASDTNSLWIAAETGLVRMRDGSFESVGPFTAQQLLPRPDGQLWIGATNGFFIRYADGKLEHPNSVPNIPIRSIARDPKGIGWIGTSEGLWQFDSGQAKRVAPSAPITSLAVGPDGQLWIAGDSFGLMRRAPGEEAPRRIWAVSAIGEVLASSRGPVWFSRNDGGLEILSPETSAATPIQLGADAVNCLFEDREGNLWVGTEGSGLAQVRRKIARLYESKPVRSIAEDTKGQIWATTDSGEIYSLKGERLLPVKLATTNAAFVVETICPVGSGGLWLGTRFDGLFRWSGQPNQPPQKFAGLIGVTALFEDRQSRLWAASGREGVTLLDRGIQRIISSPDGDAFGEIAAFAQDNSGRIYIATRRRGIAEWNGASAQWLPNQDALRQARIQTIHADAEGSLWIGSSRGVSLSRGGRLYSATTENGLYDNMIYQTAEDFRGNFWFGSNRGLFRVAKSDLEDLFAGKINQLHSMPAGMSGLEGVAGAQPTAFKADDGKLWFATRRGVAAVDPLAVSVPATFPIAIEEVRVDGRRAEFTRKDSRANIPADYRHLRVHFAALTLAAPERTEFRYQLEGFDREWLRADSTRTATYPKLPAGQYRFRVMARNQSPTWSEAAPILLRIAPRYWETLWFKISIAGAAIAIIGLFWADRIAKQRQWDAMRQQITRDLHDDLGSNIGSIALLTEALQKPTRSTDDAREILKEINHISRQTLDAMRDAVWFVDPEKDLSTDLVARLRQTAESMLKGSQYEIAINEAAGARKMPLPLKRGIVLIFKETLHNVIRHAAATKTEIVIHQENRRFGFEVRDNGKGFDPSFPSRGHGIKNLYQRAQKIGGSLKIESAPDKGTCVTFNVNIA